MFLLNALQISRIRIRTNNPMYLILGYEARNGKQHVWYVRYDFRGTRPPVFALVTRSLPGKMMLEHGHVDPSALESDSLSLQQEPLFQPKLSGQ